MAASRNNLKPIDWVSVKERMAIAVRSTEAAMILSPERARQIMDDRARSLAVPPQPDLPASESVDAVMFHLSRERYAIETRCVREVVPLPKITPLPRTVDFASGLINVRSELILVFDLRRLLGLAAHPSGTPSHVIIIGESQAEFGIAVDELPQAGRISLATMKAISEPGTGDSRSWLRGTIADALIVIDGAALIADQRLFLE
jgi:purine-binding chemotaxis protein CheW